MTLPARTGMGRIAPFETEHFKTGETQRVAELDTKFASREIRDTTNFIHRFVTRAAGHEDFHV